jgi:phosphopantothenoylcysteine synthetase/decarboxylase
MLQFYAWLHFFSARINPYMKIISPALPGMKPKYVCGMAAISSMRTLVMNSTGQPVVRQIIAPVAMVKKFMIIAASGGAGAACV